MTALIFSVILLITQIILNYTLIILTITIPEDIPMSHQDLCTISPGKSGTIDYIKDLSSSDTVSDRLRDLGFVTGETVKVIALSPFGANPIAVQIGSTRFALRQSEAARIMIRS